MGLKITQSANAFFTKFLLVLVILSFVPQLSSKEFLLLSFA